VREDSFMGVWCAGWFVVEGVYFFFFVLCGGGGGGGGGGGVRARW